MGNSQTYQSLHGPLWPLLVRAGLTLLRPRREFAGATRQFQHELPAPLPDAIQAYQQFFTFATATVPLCFYYPLLQRAQLASMLQCAGLRVAGLIHTDNQLEALTLQTPALLSNNGPLQIDTELHTETHDKGLYLVATQQLWQQQVLILRASSRYLLQKAARQKAARPKTARTAGHDGAAAEPSTMLAQIQVSSDAARRYARLSGDYNPIHLWRWSARFFGQPRPILHGMASAALLCQALPAPVQQLRLQFKTPVWPGIPLQLTQQSADEYALWQQDRLCLLAQLHDGRVDAGPPDVA